MTLAAEQVKADLKTIETLVSEGSLPEAILLNDQLIKEIEQKFTQDHTLYANALKVRGTIHCIQKQYNKAIELFEQSLKIYNKHLGEEHFLVADTLHILAVTYNNSLGRSEEALALLRRDLSIADKCVAKNSINVAHWLRNMAKLCLSQHIYEGVEDYLKMSLQIYCSKMKPDHKDIIDVNNKLAMFYMAQGMYKEAEATYKQVLTQLHEINMQANDNGSRKPIWLVAEEHEEKKLLRGNAPYGEYGGWHTEAKVIPEVTTTLLDFATLYRRLRKYEAAAVLEEYAMSTRDLVR